MYLVPDTQIQHKHNSYGCCFGCGERKIPFTCRECCTNEKWTKFINIYITDDRTSGNQALGLGYVTSYIKSFMLVK